MSLWVLVIALSIIRTLGGTVCHELLITPPPNSEVIVTAIKPRFIVTGYNEVVDVTKRIKFPLKLPYRRTHFKRRLKEVKLTCQCI